jgi:hypothetical protein
MVERGEPMSTRQSAVGGAVALILVALAAGCGGSSEGTGTTSSATATTVTDTTGAANERLTDEQWASAQESRTAFRKALADANATSTKCLHGAKSAEDFQNIPATQKCVGDVFTELQKAAGDSLAVLQGFDGTVSGTCATALSALINSVGLYQASAAEMQRTIDSPTLAGYPAASQDLETALTSGQGDVATFEKECAPA